MGGACCAPHVGPTCAPHVGTSCGRCRTGSSTRHTSRTTLNDALSGAHMLHTSWKLTLPHLLCFHNILLLNRVMLLDEGDILFHHRLFFNCSELLTSHLGALIGAARTGRVLACHASGAHAGGAHASGAMGRGRMMARQVHCLFNLFASGLVRGGSHTRRGGCGAHCSGGPGGVGSSGVGPRVHTRASGGGVLTSELVLCVG